MANALHGIRVIESGETSASAYAGKLLRDLGAEVIKVEPPSGDPLRSYGPFPGDLPDPEHSGMFIYLNGGKRGTRLDLTADEGRAAFDDLLAGADVLLHSFQPARARELGLAHETLLGSQPGLIVAALTPYGSSGPYADWKGYPIQEYAGTGVSYRIGAQEREPLTSPLDGTQLHHLAVQGALSIGLALLWRERTGEGQFVDVGAMEATNIAIWGHTIPQVMYLGFPPLARVGRYQGGGMWGTVKVADGDFINFTQMPDHWQRLLDLLGRPEWTEDPRIQQLGDPRFKRNLTIEDHQFVMEMFREHLYPWYEQQQQAELWARTREARISFHPVLSVPQVCESDQIRERDFMVEAPGQHPALQVPGGPYRLSRTPWRRPGPPPRLDDPPANAWNDERRNGSDPEAPPPAQPLSGIRVLDLTQVWAGPLLARYLADYGADVTWIRTRDRPPTSPGSSDPDDPVSWEWIYRNRRSLALNFREPEAVELFKRLCAESDIVLDNFSPRAMPRMGLGYEELTKAYPHLIMAALPPAGRTGPWSDFVTYGTSLAALFGLASLNGYPENREVMDNAAETDPVSAGYGMLAIMAALLHRNRTGEGQFIEIAQGETALAGLPEAVIEHFWNERDLGPVGNTHRVLAPHGNYPCAGDDQWIAIACGSDEEWTALARSAGHPEWLDRPDFRTAADRRAQRREIDSEIAAWTRDHDKIELMHRLQADGVAAMAQLDQLEVIGDPQLVERRQHWVLPEHFPAAELLNGNAWHLSACPPVLRRPAPEFGAHNAEILAEYLGMSESEVRDLEARGVLA